MRLKLAVLAVLTALVAAFAFTDSPAHADPPFRGQVVNPAATNRAQTSTVCVTPNVDGGVYLDGDGGLEGRKYFMAQNHGPAPLWCTVGGAIPTVNRGLRIAADPDKPFAADIDAKLRVRCTTTVAQDNVDAGCTGVVEAH